MGDQWQDEAAEFDDNEIVRRLRVASAEAVMAAITVGYLNGLDEAARVGPVSRAEALFYAETNLERWSSSRERGIREAANAGEPLDRLVRASGMRSEEVQRIIDAAR
ncbi:hypothetical protein ACFORH_39115 [Amycolatopsis roodepoortensis]|uniref:DUF222 domain-containing protein n=1 Tax=Amycolatopsis roodepoortensis TaxID=700274 RepID=A0ABR9LJR2_9PSEU|nr:hypothetical protein [Amycolatopsis roodepoortensis]MBE1580527.1 hypothetical protein [Amycolatopsis roodepoortensis]